MVRVLWTDRAIGDMKSIFTYYEKNATSEIARKIVLSIIDRADQLSEFPNLGAKEPLLKQAKRVYRCLVAGNYKIIYWNEDNYVKIATIFDVRQNPILLAEL